MPVSSDHADMILFIFFMALLIFPRAVAITKKTITQTRPKIAESNPNISMMLDFVTNIIQFRKISFCHVIVMWAGRLYIILRCLFFLFRPFVHMILIPSLKHLLFPSGFRSFHPLILKEPLNIPLHSNRNTPWRPF